MTDRRAAALAEDENARKLAQTEFHRPVVIEAGAGTGKTSILVARVVAWCLGPGWDRAASELGQGTRTCRWPPGWWREWWPSPSPRPPQRRWRCGWTRRCATWRGDTPHRRATRGASESRPGVCGRAPGGVSCTTCRLGPSTRSASDCCGPIPSRLGLAPDFEVDADGSRVEEVAPEVVEETLRRAAGELRPGPGEPWPRPGVGRSDVADAVRGLVAGASTARPARGPSAHPMPWRRLCDNCAPRSTGLHRAEVAPLAAARRPRRPVGRPWGGLGGCELTPGVIRRRPWIRSAATALEDEARSRRGWSKGTLTRPRRRLA